MEAVKEKNLVSIDGMKVAYIRQGEGDALLLVHGITTSSFIWKDIVPVLSRKYDVVAIDLPGCGDSDKSPNIKCSLKDHADCISRFIQKLGFKKVHLVTHDIGGGIGQIMAVNYPRLLNSLVMFNPVGYDYWPVQPISILATPIIRQLVMATMDQGVYRIILKNAVIHSNRMDSSWLSLFYKEISAGQNRKAFLHFAESLDNRQLMAVVPSLKKSRLPVLIVRGENDRFLNKIITLRLNKDIPGSRLVMVPDAGHFIQIDQPEECSKLITQFLDENEKE